VKKKRVTETGRTVRPGMQPQGNDQSRRGRCYSRVKTGFITRNQTGTTITQNIGMDDPSKVKTPSTPQQRDPPDKSGCRLLGYGTEKKEKKKNPYGTVRRPQERSPIFHFQETRGENPWKREN